MPSTTIYAGVDQPDVASLTTGGVFFRCYVCRNAARNTIDASIFTEQEHGQEVLAWTGIIRDVENDGGAAESGDSPRVVAVGSEFIVHWIEGRTTFTPTGVFRAVFDAAAIASGWTLLNSTPIGDHGLYDVCAIRGGSGIVVARQSSGANTSIVVARFASPWAWAGAVWTNTDAVGMDPRVLTVVSALDGGSDTVVAYQNGSQEIHARRYDTADGANPATAEIFADFGTSVDDVECCAIGLCNTQTSDEVVVVAEVCLAADVTTGATGNAYGYRSLIYKTIRGSTCASLTSTQHCPNLHLVSKPWARGSGVALQDNVYCLAAFKSLSDGQEWDQSYGFVLNLGKLEWSSGAAVGSLRPYPVSAINTGALIDGRKTATSPALVAASGPGAPGKRMNHLSGVSGAPTFGLGPDATSVTVAAVFWEQLVAQQDSDVTEGSFQPAKASVRGVRFHHADPWSRLDSSEPSYTADTNFRGLSRYSVGESVEVAGGLVYGGGVMSTYDGRQLVELGFLWRPEITLVNGTTGAAGIDAGTYWYTAVVEWPDTTGRVHRSAPATPVRATFASDQSSVAVTVRSINLSMKDLRSHYPSAAGISVVLYRTALSATTSEPEMDSDAADTTTTTSDLVFRRVYSGPLSGAGLEDTPVSDPGVARTAHTDLNTNGAVRFNDLLPWQLNTSTLQWSPATPIPTPSARVMTTWRNRLWIVPADDPRIIRYSDEILPIGSQTAAPEFFESNVLRFDSLGLVTAMYAMDNALVVFAQGRIYGVTGAGNDGTGTGASLSVQVLAEGVSCVEPRSLVYVPGIGLMFQSEKGIVALSRGQGILDTIGSPVEDLVREMGNIRSATHMPDRFEVHFVGNRAPSGSTPDPVVAIFNYQFKQWTTAELPNIAAASSALNALQSGCAWRGRQGDTCHVVLAQRGLAIERGSSDATYADVPSDDTPVAIPVDIQLGWLSFAGVSGYQRIRDIRVQLAKPQASEVSVTLDYEINGAYDAAETDTFVATSPSPGELRVRPRIQKCTAIRIRIFESGSVPNTENIQIVSTTLIVGVYRGASRIPDTQIAT